MPTASLDRLCICNTAAILCMYPTSPSCFLLSRVALACVVIHVYYCCEIGGSAISALLSCHSLLSRRHTVQRLHAISNIVSCRKICSGDTVTRDSHSRCHRRLTYTHTHSTWSTQNARPKPWHSNAKARPLCKYTSTCIICKSSHAYVHVHISLVRRTS